MKTLKKFELAVLFTAFLFSWINYAQGDNAEEFKPMYLTVTSTTWNANPEADFSDWLETEKEFFNKVTKKNDLIVGSGFYTHLYTPNSMEVLLVNVYKTWDDIEKSNEINNKLIEEGWPDEEQRKAFFKKQQAYYSADHSDEIYMTSRFMKPLSEISEKPLIYYVRQSNLAMDGEGSTKDFEEFFENIIAKNSVLKGYYSHRHLWGSNAREFSEVFVYENMNDIQKAQEETTKLINSYWPDEEKRKAFFKDFNKIFTGVHGDYIYQNVPELAK